MAEHFNNTSRIFQLALSDAIQSHSRVSNMESSRYITREEKVISPSEDESHFASKPKVKQKSSKFGLQNVPKSSRKSNSKYCHASYQTNCESSAASECGSITSEDCPSTTYSGSSTTSQLPLPVKNKDCVPFIYARPISSYEINQSEIHCGNPPSIGSPTFNQSFLNKSKQSFSFSNDDHFASLPQKVSNRAVFGTSDYYESPSVDWNIPDKFVGIENIIPPPKSSKHDSDSLFFLDDVESSTCEFFIPSSKGCNVISNTNLRSLDKLNPAKWESFVSNPKICDSKSFGCPDKTLSVNYNPVILSPRSCDSKSFSSKYDQTYFTTHATIIQPPKSCGSNSFFSGNQSNFKTGDSIIPSRKGYDCYNSFPLNVQTSAICETTIPAPKSHLGNSFPNRMDWSDQKNLNQRSSKSFHLRSKTSANCDTENLSSSLSFDNCGKDLNGSTSRESTGIYTSNHSYLKNDVINHHTESNISAHDFSVPSVKGIPVCDINIPLLKNSKRNSLETTNLRIENENKLAVEEECVKTCDLFPGNFLDELIEEGTKSLNNSISKHANNIPELPIKDSRTEFFKKQSKSIDSGLGFLSEENLTISSSDIPSESELNILPFTCIENPEENLNTNKICYKEDYSASIQSSELDGYVESEKERIDNLIDQLLGI